MLVVIQPRMMYEEQSMRATETDHKALTRMPRPNTRLKHRRKLAPLTQAELAELIGVAEVSVRRWEAGLRPQPAHIRRLCDVLKASPDQLGFGLPENALLIEAARDPLDTQSGLFIVRAHVHFEGLLVEGRPERDPLEVATMTGDALRPGSTVSSQDGAGSRPEGGTATERRDFLKLTALAAGGAPLALSQALARAAEEAVGFTRASGTSVLRRETFDDLEAALAHLEHSYGWDSPAALFRIAQAYRAEVERLIEGRHTLKEGRELYVYAGWLSWEAANLSYDLGATTTAQAYAIDCWHHAHQADHGELCGWAMDAVASIALRDKRPADALAAASRGMPRVPAQHPLAIRLRSKAARAQARLGDREHCEELLTEASDLYERLPARASMRFEADAAPLTLWAMSSISAKASLHLQDFPLAKRRAEHCLSAWASLPPEQRSPSREAQARIELAQAAAGLGSTDEAVEQGRLALSLPTVIASVLSGAGDLDRMLMARYPNIPQVRDFHDLYQQTARQASPV